MRYNVAVQAPGYTFLLTLDGFRSIREAEQAIRWQRQGDFWETMYVVEPWPDSPGLWRVHSSFGAHRYHPDHHSRIHVGGFIHPLRGCWVAHAWDALMTKLWPPKQPLMIPA
jgi:hypothetical protein